MDVATAPRPMRRLVARSIVASLLLVGSIARAETTDAVTSTGTPSTVPTTPTVSTAATDAPADPPPDNPATVMNVLSTHGLHELKDERWNAYGQLTYIQSYKLGFGAPYSGPYSLSTKGEESFTGTFTVYLGLKLWKGAEAYLVPEVINEIPLSGLKGLGGAIQNFELQKNGSATPHLYKSRLYLSQTFNFGGDAVTKPSTPMQLGSVVDSRRLTLTVGNFSILDFYDKNSYASDLRKEFFNMAFLTHSSYDFAADARGYAWGGIADLHYDDWAFRFGRITPPKDPNQLPIDFRIYKYYGDQIEVEHDHKVDGAPGVVRLLGYRNREDMGRFDDAVAAFHADPNAFNNATCQLGNPSAFNYGAGNGYAPALCWVRKPNIKVGIGIDLEQQLSDDLGVFFRAMYSDGKTEVYSYTSTDRSISVGFLGKGTRWHRAADLLGAAFGSGWISKEHAAYLALGGIDGFIGDGRIRAASERVIELFYSFNIIGGLWLSADYQHISNPAFNADRGPVDIFGGRIHAEF